MNCFDRIFPGLLTKYSWVWSNMYPRSSIQCQIMIWSNYSKFKWCFIFFKPNTCRNNGAGKTKKKKSILKRILAQPVLIFVMVLFWIATAEVSQQTRFYLICSFICINVIRFSWLLTSSISYVPSLISITFGSNLKWIRVFIFYKEPPKFLLMCLIMMIPKKTCIRCQDMFIAN